MLSTPHILVGAAIAKSIPNPYVSLPAAFLSHFVFDFIPHWDFSVTAGAKHQAAAFADYIVGLSLVFIIASGNPSLAILLLAGVAATLPDFILGGWRVLNLEILNISPLKIMNSFHLEIQNRISPVWGGLFSLITILISIFILIK